MTDLKVDEAHERLILANEKNGAENMQLKDMYTSLEIELVATRKARDEWKRASQISSERLTQAEARACVSHELLDGLMDKLIEKAGR